MASQLTKKSSVKKYAIEMAPSLRAHTFTRVSQEFLDAVEANARTFIQNRISGAPSNGKTLY